MLSQRSHYSKFSNLEKLEQRKGGSLDISVPSDSNENVEDKTITNTHFVRKVRKIRRKIDIDNSTDNN